MEALLSNKQGTCRLNLPDGLQELMSDISREVLRTQPKNLNVFITNYLSALLVTRENLSIAAAVCKETCDVSCCPELEDELRDVGLFEDDIERAKITIVKYFNKRAVNEKNLLMKLIEEADISEAYWPAIQDAIRRAFLRHQKSHSVNYESSSESGKDEVTLAVRRTLQQYRKSSPSDEELVLLHLMVQMAEKIQTSYRAYGVTRVRSTKEESNVKTSNAGEESKPMEEVKSDRNCPKISINTVSSTSLAGSYLKLPKYIPYSALDSNTSLTEFDEVTETERANIYYSNEYATLLKEETNIDAEGKLKRKTKENKRRISFEDAKNKTGSAASFVTAEGIYARPLKEGTTDVNNPESNNRIDVEFGKERENPLLETRNISEYRNINAEIGVVDYVNKKLDFLSDDIEVKKDLHIKHITYIHVNHIKHDLGNVNANENNYIESVNDFVETDNISIESENQDNEHLTTDEEIIEADIDSDCSIGEEIETSDVNQ